MKCNGNSCVHRESFVYRIEVNVLADCWLSPQLLTSFELRIDFENRIGGNSINRHDM